MKVYPRLDWCEKHGQAECTCPAWLVTMGCMDLWWENELIAREIRAQSLSVE